MTIREALQSIHLKYEKNIDYPDDSGEDTLLRLAYAMDAIRTWAKEVKEGVFWRVLKKDASQVATGTGEDDLPVDFLDFIHSPDSQAIIKSGETMWYQVSLEKGLRAKQDGNESYIFWVQAGKIKTLPAISGTMEFPYIKKPHEYTDIADTVEIEIDDSEFVVDYVVGRLFLDDDNMSQYNHYMSTARDLLLSMKLNHIAEPAQESEWGFGI